jgi:hypothetical protein
MGLSMCERNKFDLKQAVTRNTRNPEDNTDRTPDSSPKVSPC